MGLRKGETWGEYRQRNKERITKHERTRWRKNLPYSLWRGAKQRATKRDIEFSITPEDIIVPIKCPILDIEIKCNEGCHGKDSPSLDRVDPTKGYVKDNIRVISHRANALKTNMSKEVVERLYKYVFEPYRPQQVLDS